MPVGSDYSTVGNITSDNRSDDVPESLFSQLEFMLQDRMIRREPALYVGLIGRVNDRCC